MTTIQYFPSLRDYTYKTSISRNGIRKNLADFLYEWKSEDDASDYFDLRGSDDYYRLNYKIITYLLINHQELFLNSYTKSELLEFIRDNIFYYPNDTIKEYEEYMKEKEIDLNSFILGQLKNIQILYNSLIKETKTPTCYSVIDIPRYSRSRYKKEKLVLYRGFNYPRYKKILQNIYLNKVITTETFLSTSIQEYIAIKYTFNYNVNDVNKHIVWKIIIDEDMFDIFNYTFLSEPFNIHDNLETLFANGNIECEFLLNMGALLKCVDINIYDFPGYYIKGYNIPKKGYTEYTFKFIGWNTDYTDRINSNMSKYINYLK
jgi:hypothetical protein